MEIAGYSDEDLLERGRDALKLEQWPRATELHAQYLERFRRRGEDVPAGALASYGLCLGHGGDLRRGLDLAKRAAVADPRNAHVYWCLAQLHLLVPSRQNAIEAIERGLRASPDNFVLLRMRKKLGMRQPILIPFLKRDHAINVRLGRALHRLRHSGQGMSFA